MKRRRIRNPQSGRPRQRVVRNFPRRTGTTLSDVLISILAMGIGLTAVTTLFPVAILRSLNATRLTKSTIHRYNAETWVDLFPNELVHNPDDDGNFQEHFNTNYIVDPLGWELIRQDNDIAAANQFGTLPRFNGINNRGSGLTAAQLDFANRVCVSPDSWVPQFDQEITVTGTTASSATVGGVSAADLGEVSVSDPPSRIVLLDTTGRFSHTRLISGISGTTVSWTSGGALPSGFTAASARIETQERQFSWLLTVRNRGRLVGTVEQLNANVDVVVFFRRQFSKQNERVFTLTRAGASSRDFQIDASANTPFLKKGGWMLDVTNARWHRIQRIQNQNSTTPLIRLEHDPPAGEVPTRGIFMPGVVEVYHLGVKQ